MSFFRSQYMNPSSVQKLCSTNKDLSVCILKSHVRSAEDSVIRARYKIAGDCRYEVIATKRGKNDDDLGNFV